MASQADNTNHSVRNSKGHVTVAKGSGMNAFQPILLLQVSMFRMWAHSIERFAGNYQKALDEIAATVEDDPGSGRNATR